MPLRPIRAAASLVIATMLAGCGSSDGRQSGTPAEGADRAARAYERAKALEANTAQLEAELARLSGEPSPEPAAGHPSPTPATIASVERARRPRPREASPVKPRPSQPTAADLQRAIAPGGILAGSEGSPKLDYHDMH